MWTNPVGHVVSGVCWIPPANFLILYTYHGERLCTHCVLEREELIRCSQKCREDGYINEESWVKVFIDNKKFECCKCRDYDRHHKFEDNLIGRVLMYCYSGQWSHKLCEVCYKQQFTTRLFICPRLCRSSSCRDDDESFCENPWFELLILRSTMDSRSLWNLIESDNTYEEVEKQTAMQIVLEWRTKTFSS